MSKELTTSPSNAVDPATADGESFRPKAVENHVSVEGEGGASTIPGSFSSHGPREPELQSMSEDASTKALEADNSRVESWKADSSSSKEVTGRSGDEEIGSQGIVDEEERLKSVASIAESSTSESTEALPTYQPRSSAQYQLVFGMDEESSETSIPSSPKSMDTPSNPLLGYIPTGSHDLLQTASELTRDGTSESRDSIEEIDSHPEDSPNTSGNSLTLDDTLKAAPAVQEDESSSEYSGATLAAESTTSGVGTGKAVESKRGEVGGEQRGDTPTAKGGESSRSSSLSTSEVIVNLEDGQPWSRSSSKSPSPKPKAHPLNYDTSDSDAPPIPPYCPVEYHSGDEDGEEVFGNVAVIPRSPLPAGGVDSPQPSMSILFSGVIYLGSSSVDAPISETEANRKMYILKQQAATAEPIPVILSIPTTNDGTVYLKDPDSDQPLTTFPIRMILFCARGSTDTMFDCFCFNVRHKRSGTYHCHVFRCEIPEACHKIFEAIGRAFKSKPSESTLPPSTPELHCEFDVMVEIHEDDGKAGYCPVPMDKDCFKLKQNTRKKVTLSVSQPLSARPLVVERCFGLLISPGKDVKHSEMNLLDNMNCNTIENTFSVAGYWDISVPFLAPLNEETPKAVRHRYMTIAADLVLECVSEPVRFKREVKVQVSKGDSLGYFVSTLTKKKHPTETIILTLRKSEDSGSKTVMYTVVELKTARDVRGGPPKFVQPQVPSPSHSPIHPAEDHKPQLIPVEDSLPPSSSTKLKKQTSLVTTKGPVAKVAKDVEHDGDSDNSQAVDEFEEEYVVSGWGEKDDTREDLLKDWGDLLDKWDGKDRSRPKQLTKLCRKGIPRHLRCQVWQLLSGAAYDPQLHEAYRLLLSKESPTENVINWDIKRTYVGHDYFQEEVAKEALYKICKAYSVYDEEVGYCQGFSFLSAVLLLQKMPEEQAFSVLVKIMYSYGHRDVFKVNFQNLHLQFYQLDRLMEEYLGDLYQHFQANRIETHMFASQWFLTLYTAKFPLVLVFRILDIYFCERTPVVFKVALALLKASRKDLLALDFEGILNYFRVSMPRKVQTEGDCKHFFHVVNSFKVKESKLKRLEKDFQAHLDQLAQQEDPVKRLERDNKQLRDTISRLEQENDSLAQELVTSKVTLRAEMDKLEERIDTLSKEGRAQKTTSESAHLQISELKEELQQAKEEYQKVMMQLMEERQQHEQAVAEYKQLFQQLDEGHQKQKEELSQELLEVKAQLGNPAEPAELDPTHHLSSLSSEQRLRRLELELAQTKLALVESQCKNQELENRVEELGTGQVNVSQGKGRNWFDFTKKK